MCPGTPSEPSTRVIAWAEMPPFAAWEAFLDRMRPEMALFAVLAEFGLVSFGNGVIRLLGSNYYREMLQPQRGTVEQALHLHLGVPFRLEIGEGEPAPTGAPSLRLVERQRQEALQAEVVREAQTNPNIVALLSQFEGQLKHVRPLVPPTPAAR